MALGLLPPVVAELLMDIKDFQAKVGEAKTKMEGLTTSTSAAFNKVGKYATLATVGIAAASVKMAADFETQMTRLYTAAGAPEQAVKDATGQVLKLGDAVGFSGTQMAEALYHPVSAGLSLATSLQAVKYSAEEAQISGASLDDTTYALSSVMKAFNQDATQAHDTMALLNSIVGQGDMRFQDFNTSVKNWAPTAAQMGISIQSMGAALAYLTDRGNSAEEAATRVTMGLSMMTTPSKQAASLLEGMGVASSDVSASSEAMTEVLKKTGITQNQLAADLKSPDGIYVALTHLKTALDDAGIHGTEADSVLAKIFGGGRSDKAIMSLLQNLDGLKTKFDDIGAGAGKFDQAWAATQQTFSFKMKQLGADAENLGIAFGMKLIPAIEAVVSWFDKNQWAVLALAGVIGGVLLVSVVRYAQTLTTSLITALAKAAVSIKAMGDSSEEAAVKQEAAAASAEKWGGKLGAALPVVGAVMTGAVMLAQKLNDLAGQGDKAGMSADQLAAAMLDTSGAGGQLNNMMQASGMTADTLGGKWNAPISTIAQLGIVTGKTAQLMGDASKISGQYDAALAQLVQSGNASQAKSIMDDISAAADAQGKKIINTAKDFPQYFAALAHQSATNAEAATSTDDATAAVDANSVAMDQNAKAIGQALDAGDSLNDAIKAVTDSYSALTANLSTSEAMLDFKKDLLSVTDEIKKNGRAFDDNSLKGIANMQAFQHDADAILKTRDAAIQAAGGQHASADAIAAANKVASDQAQQLLDVWGKLTGNKKAVDAYATSIGLIPKDMSTAFSTPGLSSAIASLQQYAQLVGAPTGRGGSRVATNAAGGYISGPGSGTSDSILSWLSNGEYVVSAAAVSSVGRPFLDAINNGHMPPAPRASTAVAAGGGGNVMVQVVLDGRVVNGAVRTQTLRYDYRNSGNNLALAGRPS